MDSPRRFSLVWRWRLKAGIVVALLAASSQLGQAAFGSAALATTPVALHQSCSVSSDAVHAPLQGCPQALSVSAPVDESLRLTLPAGRMLCPSSGPSASCESVGAPALTPGVASLPSGLSACPLVVDKRGPNAPGSCNTTLLAPSQTVEPARGVGTTFLPIRVTPSVPISTLTSAGIQPRVRLTSSTSALQPGQSALLTATANVSVTGTPSAIEIFDQSTGTLVGACMLASQCLVSYTAKAGVHTFAAYITPPVASQPIKNTVTSNSATVAWFGVALASSPSIVAPGKSVTFTATSTADVAGEGYQLGLYDTTSGAQLTFCSRGTSCSTTLTKDLAGTRSIVAYVSGPSAALPPPSIQAQSKPITATWLGVTLDASTTHPHLSGDVVLRAIANVDVTNTPWSIGIYNDQGELVNAACKLGTICDAQVTLGAGATPWFTAVIGAARQPGDTSSSTALIQVVQAVQAHTSLVNIQARSTAVQPTRLLWGVDSCKPITSDAAGNGGLFADVRRHYGSPDFWARYLTDTYNCPGISSTEIAAASYRNLGLLPIYNNYDCNAVRTYRAGLHYAMEAVAAAITLGIPAGTVLAVDIEPYGAQCPGAARVDAGFIEGWYDGITFGQYAPMYYGNGTAGSEFATAWCGAVSVRPEIAVNSYLWSFEPSLLGRFTKKTAPGYSPELPGCSANVAAWQYVLSSGGKPDVDSDEALSKLPLWFPQGGG